MPVRGRSPGASMDASLVELTRRLAAGDPTARAELARHPGDMARALDEIVTVMERRTALLAETEQYFDALAQQSLMGVYVAARDRFLYANQALATITGYTVDEILGSVVLMEVVHPEDWPTVARNLKRRFRGETFRASFRLMRKDGGIVLVEADGRRVVRKGEPVIIGAVIAVDTLKRGRTEARRQRQALFRSERMAALGELLGGLAHELDGSLTGALAQARVIEEMAGAGPVADQALRMAEQAHRAGQIVRRFSALAHDYPSERGEVAVNPVMREVVDLFDYALKRAKVNVVLALAEGLPTIWGDAHRLHELAAHLIANAIQAMRGCPAPRRLSIQTLAIPETKHVAFEVSDTGPGVSDEARSHLFEPFFSTKPAGIGTGLGLFVCLEIAQEHRGSVALVTRAGRGPPFAWSCPSAHPISADRSYVLRPGGRRTPATKVWTSTGANGLERTNRTPERIASSWFSLSPQPVTNPRGTRGKRRRHAAATSQPDMPGMETSARMRSTASLSQRANPSSPLAASTTVCPMDVSMSRSTDRTSRSSSMTST